MRDWNALLEYVTKMRFWIALLEWGGGGGMMGQPFQFCP
jgi:hypothetical protein